MTCRLPHYLLEKAVIIEKQTDALCSLPHVSIHCPPLLTGSNWFTPGGQSDPEIWTMRLLIWFTEQEECPVCSVVIQ